MHFDPLSALESPMPREDEGKKNLCFFPLFSTGRAFFIF
jgi:hypothetical protein